MTSATPAPVSASHQPDPATDDVLLQVTGLNVEFQNRRGWFRVVEDISFDVGRGEVLGLVGESGSGKTVSSLAVIGLLPRRSRVAGGTARFEQRDLLAMSPREMRAIRGNEISMVFQDALNSLNPAFTIGDQVAEVVRAHRPVSRKAAMARAKEMLELVEIPNAQRRLEDYPHMFSGGMCQRVMLAIALACEPKLLFADEPTTALDVTVQSQVLELLRSLRQDLNLSVVFITHDFGIVAELCDRVAVMYAGQVIEIGARDEIFFEPHHPYTSALLRSIPAPTAEDERSFGFIPGQVASPGSWPIGCHFHPRCEHCQDGTCTTAPIELVPAPGSRSVSRCVRSSELDLRGVAP